MRLRIYGLLAAHGSATDVCLRLRGRAQAALCLNVMVTLDWFHGHLAEVSRLSVSQPQELKCKPELLVKAFLVCVRLTRAALETTVVSASGSVKWRQFAQDAPAVASYSALQHMLPLTTNFTKIKRGDAPSTIACFHVTLKCMTELALLQPFATEVKHRPSILSSVCALLALDTAGSVTDAALSFLSTVLERLELFKVASCARAVDVAVFFPLVESSRRPETLALTLRCIWTLVRNRDSQAAFVARLLHQIQDESSQTDCFLRDAVDLTDVNVPVFEIDVLRCVKDAIQSDAMTRSSSSSSGAGGLEAAYGILAILAKTPALHDAILSLEATNLVIEIASEHTQPSLLLSTLLLTSRDAAVSTQQWKFVLHLCRSPDTLSVVVAQSNVISDLKAAVLSPSPRVRSPACQVLELLTRPRDDMTLERQCSVATRCDRDRRSAFKHLLMAFEEREHELLHGVYVALAAVTKTIEHSERSLAMQKAACASVGVLSNLVSPSNVMLASVRSVVIETASVELTRHLLRFVDVTMSDSDAQLSLKRCVLEREMRAREQALRVVQFVATSPRVTAHFGIQAPHHDELLDLLFVHLKRPRVAAMAASWGESHTRAVEIATLEVLQHVTRDVDAAVAVVTRSDALETLFDLWRSAASIAVARAVWRIFHNVAFRRVHLGHFSLGIARALSDNIAPLGLSKLEGGTRGLQSLIAMVFKTLRMVASQSLDGQEHFVALLPVLIRFCGDGGEDEEDDSSTDDTVRVKLTPSIVENAIELASFLAPFCQTDMSAFVNLLDLSKCLLARARECRSKDSALTQRHLPIRPLNNERVTPSRGIDTAIERLVEALCGLLGAFHDDEQSSVFPGYEQLWLPNAPQRLAPTTTQLRSTLAPGGQASVAIVDSANPEKRYRLRCKKTGVFCNGYSPPTYDLLKDILEIFSVASAFCREEDATSCGGTVRDGNASDSSSAQCIRHVARLHYRASKSVSGRFTLLNTVVITFWREQLRWMRKRELRVLCEMLRNCALSKMHTPTFLSSGSVTLLVQAVCTGVKLAATAASKAPSNASKPRLSVSADAFLLVFVQSLAVLSERPRFLQSTYYLVHAGEKDGITIPSLLLAAIVHARGCSTYLLLATKILARLFCLLSLKEAQVLLASCAAQIERSLAWHPTPHELALALLTTVALTESEAIMKIRVVVKVIHSTLLRTALLGLIDKGVPEVLHDFGLSRMMASMEKVQIHCKSYVMTARVHGVQLGSLERPQEAAPAAPERRGRRPSFLLPVDRLAAGINAVGEAALNVGANMFLPGSSQRDSDDALAVDSTGHVEDCVSALRELAAEVRDYAESNYKTVFESFEKANDDLELIEAMKSSGDGIMFAQTTFYATTLLHEALTAALLESNEPLDRTASLNVGVKSKRERASSDGRSAAQADEVVEMTQTAEQFLCMVERVIEWIVISLQHSDMDLLFYAIQLDALFQCVARLFALPLQAERASRKQRIKRHKLSMQSSTPRVSRTSAHRFSRSPATRELSDLTPRADAHYVAPHRIINVCVQSLEIRSWFWTVLGFLPYLTVKHQNETRLVLFRKRRHIDSGRLSVSTTRGTGVRRRSVNATGTSILFWCEFDAADTALSAADTRFRDLPHAIDVEVWIYLPFWFRDYLISRVKIPLLGAHVNAKPRTWKFYPTYSRRAYAPAVAGTVEIDLRSATPLSHELALGQSLSALQINPPRRNEFPAYSTLGSHKLRQVLRMLYTTARTLVSSVYGSARKFVRDETDKRRRKSSHAGPTSGETTPEASVELSLAESVDAIVSQILAILRLATHPDKLIGSYEKHNVAFECEGLVDQLDKGASEFTRVLTRGFETPNPAVWRKFADAFAIVRSCYLQSGLRFFEAQLEQAGSLALTMDALPPSSLSQRESSDASDSDFVTSARSPSVVASGSFRGFHQQHQHHRDRLEQQPPLRRWTFREVSSQIRYLDSHFSEVVKTEPDQKHSGRKWSLLDHGAAAAVFAPVAGMIDRVAHGHAAARMRRVVGISETSDTERLAARASAHLHSNSRSKVEWRLVLPHVSLWNLSQSSGFDRRAYSRMVAPTSLNHFLVQPMERLQLYCTVLQFLYPLYVKKPKAPLPSAGTPRAGSSSSRIASFQAKVSAREASDGGLKHVTERDVSKSSMRQSVDGEDDEPLNDSDADVSKMLTTMAAHGPMPPSATVAGPSPLYPKLSGMSCWARWRLRWLLFLAMSKKSKFVFVQNKLMNAFMIEDCAALEVVRARQLMKYHAMDPFDAAGRLSRLYYDAQAFPAVLYREGALGTAIHYALWIVLTATVWRISVARDAVRDSAKSFRELFMSQLDGEDWVDMLRNAMNLPSAFDSSPASSAHAGKEVIIISDRHRVQPQQAPTTSPNDTPKHRQRRVHDAKVAETVAKLTTAPTVPSDCIRISKQELRHFVILLEVKRLLSDMVRIWPIENGNLGLGDFWSSLKFTALALGSPLVFIYRLVPWLLAQSDRNVEILSNIACAYGLFWILLAFLSILSITHSIPAFREVRRVDRVNLTTFPYCVRNYLAILSVVWECFQLNTTSFAVWEMSYEPKRLAALTTIDLQDLGLGVVQVNVFAFLQRLALLCLVLWCFCLKASNKFKSFQWLNYVLTFLLPNLLGGMLFMVRPLEQQCDQLCAREGATATNVVCMQFLSKQFYLSTACSLDSSGETVMIANPAIRCWRDTHLTYALRGMFGMSLFVPLAVLAFGSYQVFFPELKLDVQTSPLLNVSSQIVKAAMTGALTFFIDRVVRSCVCDCVAAAHLYRRLMSTRVPLAGLASNSFSASRLSGTSCSLCSCCATPSRARHGAYMCVCSSLTHF